MASYQCSRLHGLVPRFYLAQKDLGLLDFKGGRGGGLFERTYTREVPRGSVESTCGRRKEGWTYVFESSEARLSKQKGTVVAHSKT